MALQIIGRNPNLVALRAVVTVPEPVEYDLTFVLGVNTFYAWDTASTDSDDDDLVIRPTDRASSAGRWLKVT